MSDNKVPPFPFPYLNGELPVSQPESSKSFFIQSVDKPDASDPLRYLN
jgi:hypothetical protein